jgi:YD repeat-containing protein
VVTSQSYDWKGRPTVTTNPDNTTKQASYTGCGCAGGEVVTLTGETVSQGNRRQKIYHDALGRVVKTEVLNWDGTPYSAAVNSYNALDQITNVRQYAGPEGSPTYQDTVMTYDGYGRLATEKIPAATSPTSYSYNVDDTLQTVTDGRGATSTFSYNARHLVTGIGYSAPSGITGTSAVSYGYDAMGNRTGMTDGSGSTTYQYNTLSQLQSETRTFSGLSGSYTLSYSYNLAGQVASVTDPFNAQINYSYDHLGRLSAVTGSAFGGITQYASNMQYRAWGTLKHVNYGNSGSTLAVDIGYNAKMQPTSYTVPGVMQKSYQYNSDGSLRYSQDNLNGFYDRAYTYDHAGRLTGGLSGVEARGGTFSTWHDGPYNVTFSYDAMNHVTGRTTRDWNRNYSRGDVYQNDRASGWGYDADGRVLNNADAWYAYDAAGRTTTVWMDSTTTQTFDGDGQSIKTVESVFNEQTWAYENTTKLYVRSSLLGGRVISEIDEQGNKLSSYVYAGEGVLARQVKGVSPYSNDYVTFEHRDPSGASLRTTDGSGNTYTSEEYDPLRADANLGPTLITEPPPDEYGSRSLLDYSSGSTPSFLSTSYTLDGIPVSSDFALQQIASGAAVLAPSWTVVSIRYTNGQTQTFGGFTNLPPGFSQTFTDARARLAATSFFFDMQHNVPFGEAVVSALGWGNSLRGGMDGGRSSAHFSFTPQTAGANPFPTFSKDDLKIVKDSIKLAQELTKKSGCDQALKSYGIPSLAALINAMVPNSNVFDGRTSTLTGPIGNKGATQSIAGYFKEKKADVGAAVFPNSMSGRGPVTFLGDYFFNPQKVDWVAFQRAIIMLHEAVHQVANKGDALFGSSKELSEKIIEKCYPVLKGKLGGVG